MYNICKNVNLQQSFANRQKQTVAHKFTSARMYTKVQFYSKTVVKSLELKNVMNCQRGDLKMGLVRRDGILY